MPNISNITNTNFYDELDLRYPELAICVDTITINGKNDELRFVIPVLTPNMEKYKGVTEKIHQDNSMFANKEKPEVQDITRHNYVYIRIPEQLTTIPDKSYNYDHLGYDDFVAHGEYDYIQAGHHDIESEGLSREINSTYYMLPNVPGDYTWGEWWGFSVTMSQYVKSVNPSPRYIAIGTLSFIGIMQYIAYGTLDYISRGTEDGVGYMYTKGYGVITLFPIPTYLKPPTKWIVVFLGGDVGKPQIIARYKEPVTGPDVSYKD